MSEFQKQGGSLGGREERTDAFQGEPRTVGGTLGGHGASGTTSLTEKEGGHGIHGTHGHHNTATQGKYEGGAVGSTNTTHGYNDSTTGRGGSGHDNSTATTKKPGLMDKLNPMKDTDNDGKKGIMD